MALPAQLTTLGGMTLRKALAKAEVTQVVGMRMTGGELPIVNAEVTTIVGMVMWTEKPAGHITTLRGMKLMNKAERVVLPESGALLNIRCY